MPSLRPEQLAAHLARGVQPLYTVHGDDALLVQEAADAIRQAARAAGCSERSVFTVSGAHFDWSSVLGAAQEMSLFAERRLLEIRMPSGKPGKEGGEALARYCSRLAEDVVTLVQLPRLDGQQSRSAWFAALESAGISVRVDTVARKDLPAWLAQRLAAQGQRVQPGDAGVQTLAFFADRVEGNLLAAHQEVQKLALLHPPGELSFEQVQDAVLNVARYDLPKLTEALWRGQTARTLRLLHGLRAEGESAVSLHWNLAADVRALVRARQALDQGRPLPVALRESGVWGPKEKLFEPLLAQLALPALKRCLLAAAQCDGVLKGLRRPDWPAEPWSALEHWVLMLLAATRPAR